MRYIKTSNDLVEFIEASNEGQILSVRAFQFGELYFQIKNRKVTFYLNDQENPWRNDVWSADIPLQIDEEVYETEEETSAALHSIMNDSFQEQLDELKEDLAAEEARAQEAEEQLDDKIDDETERAISAETHLQTEITELSGAVSNIDARVTRNTNDISALTDALNSEISRSTTKDAEHDALISGLTNGLDNEIQRAMSAETVLHNEILAERDRALAAESALTNTLNSEITRSTAKDAEHDAEISGLSTSLQNEINRAVGAENTLRNDLNNEISARTASDNTQNQRITALEVGKADKSDLNNYYTKTESDNKYATKEYISGLTENIYTKDETNALLDEKADKISSVASAQYNSQNKTIDFKNISGTVISSIDARDFIKDGMVDNVVITNGNLVITFNTDAGKEPISIPLTSIFDPTNYYSKDDIDAKLSGKTDVSAFTAHTADTTIHFTSGDVQNQISAYTYDKHTIDEKVASGGTFDPTNYYTKSEVDASQLAQDQRIDELSGNVQTLSGQVQTISGNSYTKQEVDGKLANKADLSVFTAHTADTTIHFTTAAVQTQISNYTYDKATIDEKVASGGTFDPTQYYTTANTYSKTEVNGLLGDKADLSALTSHTANTSIHVTASEKSNWNGKQDQLTAGSGITIVNNVISATGGSAPIDAYTKAESDAKFATITNLNSHSGNTTMHITQAERNAWNAKADASNVYNKTEVNNLLAEKPNVWCGNESEWSQISGSTESGTIYLVY